MKTAWRVCTKCRTPRSVEEFNKDRKRKDGIALQCGPCVREQANDLYRRKSEVYKAKAKRHRQKLKPEMKRLISEIRVKYGCAFCGEKTDCILDFHHLEHRKDKGGDPVSRAMTYGRGRVIKEINKCVVLCANCHRKVHAGLLTLKKEMLCHEPVIYKPRLFLPKVPLRRCHVTGTPGGEWTVVFRGAQGKEISRLKLNDDREKAKYAAYSRRLIAPYGWDGDPDALSPDWREESLRRIRRCPMDYFKRSLLAHAM